MTTPWYKYIYICIQVYILVYIYIKLLCLSVCWSRPRFYMLLKQPLLPVSNSVYLIFLQSQGVVQGQIFKLRPFHTCQCINPIPQSQQDVIQGQLCSFVCVCVCFFFLCKFSGRWVFRLIKISFLLLLLVSARYPEEPF